MAITTQTDTLTDMDVLYTFEASAAASVSAYAMSMTKVHDEALRNKLHDLMESSFKAQQQARNLLIKLGGSV